MIWKKILLVGLAVILAAGCVEKERVRPPKPTITAVEYGELICFSKEDSIKLGGYLQDLEASLD